jgi:septum site-determining protein MinD
MAAAKKTLPIRSVAIVSGKGGSGKTMVAATLGLALAREGFRTLLVDADLGTGGLTYYLGFNSFERVGAGLTEFLISKRANAPLETAKPRQSARFDGETEGKLALLPVGEHRLIGNFDDTISTSSISRLISKCRGNFDIVIFDCRGGVDHDSIETCQSVDDVIIVVETDAAAIQASQYLVEQMYDHLVGPKLAGFVLNKVMDDPSSLAKAGTSFFRTRYLGAVPFDIGTTRDFIKGDMPATGSIFFRNVAAALLPLFDVKGAADFYRPVSAKEMGSIGLRNPDSLYGAAVIGMIAVYAAVALVATDVAGGAFELHSVQFIFGAFALVIAALSENLKQGLGSILRRYVSIARKMTRLKH